MDLTDTGNPGTTLHDLGDVAAKIRDDIRYYVEAENLTASGPEEAQEYEDALDRWNSPGATLEDKLRHVKLRRCGVRLIPLIGRIHAIFLQLESEFSPLRAYRQQFDHLPIVTDHTHAGSWMEIATQLDVVVQLLQDAEVSCRRKTAPQRAVAWKATTSPTAEPDKLVDVIKQIKELRDQGCSHRDICDRLGDSPRPQTVKWKALSWPKAFGDRHHSDAVKTWISKCCHPPVISQQQQ